MKIVIVVLLCCLAAGCSSLGSAPMQSTSGLDGSRRVQVRGHGGDCSGFVCSGLGASWTSARPDRALLTVHVFNETCAVYGAKVRAGVEVIDLGRPVGLTQFSRPSDYVRESVQVFDVPLGLVRRLAASDSAWLRVSTSVGQVEDRLDNSRATAALGRLLSAIDGGK